MSFLKIVVRLKSIEEIGRINLQQVDVFGVDGDFSVKKIAYFTLNDIKNIKQSVIKKEVFVYLNKMIHEADLEPLEAYLEELKKIGIDGIVINDLTVYVLAKKLGIENKIIYQPGTMNTDSFSAQYFSEKNILGITISREITLEEIMNIAHTQTKTGFSLIGHGYLDMFYSKRKLLKNYFLHKQIDKSDIMNNKGFRLNEEMRQDQYYPILEDEFGSHVFRSKKLISIDELKILEPILDYFFIERIFMSDEEYFDSLDLYNNIITKEHFLEKYPDYDSGFYYQRTEKIKGDLDEN